MSTTDPHRLSDPDLEAAVKRLSRSEREVTASLVAHLAELYGRRLHERAGYDSLFTYCVEALRLSESAAYDRMKAAKVVRRYPLALALLAQGRVNLTTVRLIAPHLTRENHRELLEEVSGKRKRQVLEVLARRLPQPDVPLSVRKLPTPASSLAVPVPVRTFTPPAEPTPLRAGTAAPGTVGPSVALASAAPPLHELTRPLSPDRYQFTFTGGSSVRDKLEMAQDLLSHVIPNGDPAQVLERGLDLLLEDLVKRKFALTDRPGTGRESGAASRYVPAEVKRTVYIRDRGCCAFVAPGGRRCGARGFLEFHHLNPYAAGGKATIGNISLRCRAHNRYEAEVFYGAGREYGGVGVVRERKTAYGRVSGDTFSFRNEDSDNEGRSPSAVHAAGGLECAAVPSAWRPAALGP